MRYTAAHADVTLEIVLQADLHRALTHAAQHAALTVDQWVRMALVHELRESPHIPPRPPECQPATFRLPHAEAILELLRDRGAMTVEDIALLLDAAPEAIHPTIRRLSKRAFVQYRKGGLYELRQPEEAMV